MYDCHASGFIAVYTIWNASTIKLPTLITNDMVLSKLQDGADLFAPGISRSSIAGLPDDLPQGSIVGIGTLSVPGAVRAVGGLCCDVRQLKKDQVGKAVEVLHVEGDQLWSLGSKLTAIPRSVNASTETQEDGPNGHSAQKVESPGIEHEASAEQQEGASNSTSELSTPGKHYLFVCSSCSPLRLTLRSIRFSDVDACLKESVLYSIVHHLSKQSNLFPITSSKFMDTYVLPSRRAAIIHPQTSHDGPGNQALTQEVSIKKSSYKNASAFLKQMKKEGLLSTKEVKGGEVVVVGVDGTHAE
jgi:translation initiation factor 2D